MSPYEMEDFLSEGTITRIATTKPHSPHITSVCYLWEKNHLLIIIVKGSIKESKK